MLFERVKYKGVKLASEVTTNIKVDMTSYRANPTAERGVTLRVSSLLVDRVVVA